jgi:hypothetical protein
MLWKGSPKVNSVKKLEDGYHKVKKKRDKEAEAEK